MAFTIRVTERHDLDMEPAHGCDTCATDSTNSAAMPAPQVAPGQVGTAIAVQLSPLED